jgi:hypothetical protein
MIGVLRDWSQLLPPPHECQRRGWECAYVLLERHQHRLDGAEWRFCASVLIAEPDSLGWREIAEMLALHGRLVARRV